MSVHYPRRVTRWAPTRAVILVGIAATAMAVVTLVGAQDETKPPVLPDLPDVPPKIPGDVSGEFWASQPDPAALGYDPADFWYDTDMQVGLPSDGWGIWWGHWMGFPDWRYCHAVCRDNSKCNYWLFVWDPSVYLNTAGGCYFKTGPFFAGLPAPGYIRTISSHALLQPNLDPKLRSLQRIEDTTNCMDRGFNYADQWLKPNIIKTIENVASAEVCRTLCVEHVNDDGDTDFPPTESPSVTPINGSFSAERLSNNTAATRRSLNPRNRKCIAWQYDDAPLNVGWPTAQWCVLMSNYVGKRQTNPWAVSGAAQCGDDLTSNFPTVHDHVASDPAPAYPNEVLPACWKTGVAFQGEPVDIAQSDAGTKSSIYSWVTSLPRCAEYCSEHSDCMAYTWGPSFGGCYLYKSVQAAYVDSAVISSGKDCDWLNRQPVAPAAGDGRRGLQWNAVLEELQFSEEQLKLKNLCEQRNAGDAIELNTDYNGGDMESPEISHGYWFVKEPLYCYRLCRLTFGCTYWTHDDAANICWIKESKSMSTVRRQFRRLTSGATTCHVGRHEPVKCDVTERQPPFPDECGSQIMRNVDLNYGMNLAAVEGPEFDSWQKCQTYCFANVDCTHFVFVIEPWNFHSHGGHCYLKKLVDNGVLSTAGAPQNGRRLVGEHYGLEVDDTCYYVKQTRPPNGVETYAGPASCTEARHCANPIDPDFVTTTVPPVATTTAEMTTTDDMTTSVVMSSVTRTDEKTTDEMRTMTDQTTTSSEGPTMAPDDPTNTVLTTTGTTTGKELTTTIAKPTTGEATTMPAMTVTVSGDMIQVFTCRLLDVAYTDPLDADVALSFRNAVADSVLILVDQVKIVLLSPGSTIVDWLPQGDHDLIEMAQRWAAAVADPSSPLRRAFNIDPDFPSVRSIRADLIASNSATTTTTKTTKTITTTQASGCAVGDFECQGTTKGAEETDGLGPGAIVGIAAGAVVGLLAVGGVGFFAVRKNKEKKLATNAIRSSPSAGRPIGSPGNVTPGGMESGRR